MPVMREHLNEYQCLYRRSLTKAGCSMFFQINVRVTTMDAELEFAIQPNTTGKQLFDQVGARVVNLSSGHRQ